MPPDPGVERAERVRALPFTVYGLVPQPSLEDHDAPGLGEGRDADGPTQTTVAVTYTLWRNPDDHDDPVNLADLPERTRAALDEVPPWPRPSWLAAGVARMRYRMLWEGVRTTWTREPWEFATLPQQLVQHVNHILINRFAMPSSGRLWRSSTRTPPASGRSPAPSVWRRRPSG